MEARSDIPTKVVISRSEWSRVKEDGSCFLHSPRNNALLTNEGGKCCLGFWCEQVKGLQKDDLHLVIYPSDLGIEDITFWIDIGNINDRLSFGRQSRYEGVSDETQESMIKEWFKKNLNCDVTFTD